MDAKVFLKICICSAFLVLVLTGLVYSSTTTRTTTSKTTTSTSSSTTKTTTSSTTTLPVLMASMNAQPNPAKSGQSVSIVARWSGGKPPYTATLYSGLTSSCSGSSSSASFTSTSETYYSTPAYPREYYCLTVTDSLGHSSSAGPLSIAVLQSSTTSTTTTKTTTSTTSIIPHLSVTLSVRPTSVSNGQSVSITARWSGGKPPYTPTLYSSFTNACSGSSSSASGFTATSETYTSTLFRGEYFCEVVADSSGQTARSGIVYVAVR